MIVYDEGSRWKIAAQLIALCAIWLTFFVYQIFTLIVDHPIEANLGLLATAFSGVAALALTCVVIQGPLSPAGAPMLYLGCVLFLPPIYVLQSGENLFLLNQGNVTQSAIWISIYSIGSFFVGSMFSGLIPDLNNRARFESTQGNASGETYIVGLGLVVLSCAGKLYVLAATWGQAYGADQFSGSLPVRLNQLSIIAAIVGAAIMFFEHSKLKKKISGRFGLFFVFLSCLLALTSGGRFQVLVIILLMFIFKWRFVGIKRPLLVPLAAAAMVLIFTAVGLARGGDIPSGSAGAPPIYRTVLTDLSSVFLSISMTEDYVASDSDLLFGRTYLVSIPGGRQILDLAGQGLEAESGAMAFRTLIGMNDPNLGLGFSLPAEAYLNFGLLGVVVFSFVWGTLLSLLYRQFRRGSLNLTSLSYVVLIACLPYTFRADLLSAINMWIYPVAIAFGIQMLSSRKRGLVLYSDATSFDHM